MGDEETSTEFEEGEIELPKKSLVRIGREGESTSVDDDSKVFVVLVVEGIEIIERLSGSGRK